METLCNHEQGQELHKLSQTCSLQASCSLRIETCALHGSMALLWVATSVHQAISTNYDIGLVLSMRYLTVSWKAIPAKFVLLHLRTGELTKEKVKLNERETEPKPLYIGINRQRKQQQTKLTQSTQTKSHIHNGQSLT